MSPNSLVGTAYYKNMFYKNTERVEIYLKIMFMVGRKHSNKRKSVLQYIIFQPKNELPLHLACVRTSSAVSVVQLLLRAAVKDQRLTSDKVLSNLRVKT